MPPRIPTSDWLQSKFKRLLEMTDIVSQECPSQYSEPEYGFWSLKKEIALVVLDMALSANCEPAF